VQERVLGLVVIGALCILLSVNARPDSADAGGLKAATSLAPYVIQPGDELQVQVLNLPELTASVLVRPDGMISLMLLDDVRVAGRTVQDVKKEVSEGYARHYRNPQVAVFARKLNNQRVYVTGEVARPGGITIAPAMTAMQAVAQAGGLLRTAMPNEAVVLRQSAGGDRTPIPVRLGSVLKGEAQDLLLQAADTIYVPKSDIRVFVGGEVGKPGLQPLEGNLTALSAVMNAGGFLDTASQRGAVLIRKKGELKPEVVQLRLDQVLKGEAVDVELQPFDIVFVPKSNIAKVDKAVDQYIRKAVPLMLTGGFSYILGGNFGAGTGVNCFF